MSLRDPNYWDDHYKLELRNYKDDGDEGEIWFGKGLSRKIAQYITDGFANKQASVLDIGCGNAFLLTTLVKRLLDNQQNTAKQILGVDYSANSIQLSKLIVADANLSEYIDLEQCDILDTDQVRRISSDTKFGYIVDKGTYDAICLLASDSEDKLNEVRRKYLDALYELADANAVFIFASCNSTKEELLELFVNHLSEHKAKPELIGDIATPTIQFGGKSGSQVTCLILRL